MTAKEKRKKLVEEFAREVATKLINNRSGAYVIVVDIPGGSPFKIVAGFRKCLKNKYHIDEVQIEDDIKVYFLDSTSEKKREKIIKKISEERILEARKTLQESKEKTVELIENLRQQGIF